MVFWIFYFAVIIFMIVVQWKIYVKAGKPGWGCIVPIYNAILQLQIACRPIWWIFLMLIPVVNIVIAIIILFDFAKVFGKGSGFAIGMLFLPIIFFPILAFDSSEYQEIIH
ncbi:MAG: signal peptidase I [Candidatus Cloacimonetes bacterium]|nr:signal peptidase I [Candidatus Cloacimonadota bacterium]